MSHTRPVLTISKMQLITKGKTASLWVGNVGVFFVNGIPSAITHADTVYVKREMSLTTLRKTVQWLRSCNLGTYDDAVVLDDFNNTVFSLLSLALQDEVDHAIQQ